MKPSRAVISGASRGIGRAVAVALARRGTALALIGRDPQGLASTASACRERGADTAEAVLDVRDRPALADFIERFDDAGPVDLVIANAGIALPPGEIGQDRSAYEEIDVNLVGALNTVLPLLPRMTERGRGQVAFVSSLAAYAPLPSSPGYSASKAAVLVYGLALRERVRPRGVRVSVICPGYVDTAMGTRYEGWRPLSMSAEAAALRIVAGLARDLPVIAFPRRLALAARLATLVPEGVRRLGLSAFQFSIRNEPRGGP